MAPDKSRKASPVARKQAPHSEDPAMDDLFTTLARAGLFLQALQRESLGQHDLTFTEYSVLRLLSRAPEQQLSPSVLAHKIVCTTGAMTKLVDRLGRNKLVTRSPDPADRRGIQVEITRAGEDLASRAAKSYQTGRRRVLSRLEPHETDPIHTHLSRLLGALEADNDSN
jgi:DNA-binding MarR family transcriptional regulator